MAEEIPSEVKAFVDILRLNIVDKPIKVQPPGFMIPVWLIPVKDEGTGETVGILNAYPPKETERYRVITITNKLGNPVNVITFKEEAERLVAPKPKIEEVEKVIEEAEKKVPEKVAPAPIDWSWMGALATKLESWVEAMTKHAINRSALSVYTLAKSANEFLKEANDKLLGVELIKKHEERKKPALKVLTEEEYKKLWENFSEALRKEGINPEAYKERFDELIAWNMPYEDNEFIIMDEARKIIVLKEFRKYIRKLPVKPVSFNWRFVDWALGSLRISVGLFKDAVKQKNAVQAYTAVKDMLETFDKLKDLLRLSPDVGGF